MSSLVEIPQDQVRTQSHERIVKTLAALKRLRSGGTASDVRETLMDLIDDTISVMTVRRYLWLLKSLGLAEFSEVDNSRWWQAVEK